MVVVEPEQVEAVPAPETDEAAVAACSPSLNLLRSVNPDISNIFKPLIFPQLMGVNHKLFDVRCFYNGFWIFKSEVILEAATVKWSKTHPSFRDFVSKFRERHCLSI